MPVNKNLESICSQVRRDILRMVHNAKSGHPGGSLGCTISHAMSRAMCKLIVISTDDNKILTKACEKGKLQKKSRFLPLPPSL